MDFGTTKLIMSAFESPSAGAAGIVFLVLYTFFVALTANIVFRKEGIMLVYMFLFVYGIIRWGAQLCGTVYAAIGAEHWQWLVAYLVLGAEGYFILVLLCFNYLAKAQIRQFGFSALKPKGREQKQKHALFGRFLAFFIFHYLLIPANVLVIYGGTSVSGMTLEELANNPTKEATAKGCRTAGQAMFLSLTLVVYWYALDMYYRQKVRQPELTVMWFTFPFLVLRGVYGIMLIFIPVMNYFDMSNYTSHGTKDTFIILEYCLATTPEFITAALLIGVYYYRYYRMPESDVEAIKLEEVFVDKAEQDHDRHSGGTEENPSVAKYNNIV